MIKYISIFWLVLRCLLVGRKENSTGFSTGLTGRSKNLDPTGFHLWIRGTQLMLGKIHIWLMKSRLVQKKALTKCDDKKRLKTKKSFSPQFANEKKAIEAFPKKGNLHDLVRVSRSTY